MSNLTNSKIELMPPSDTKIELMPPSDTKIELMPPSDTKIELMPPSDCSVISSLNLNFEKKIEPLEKKRLIETKDGWSKHQSKDGVTYYYHRKTKKSSWFIPPSFQKEIEKPNKVTKVFKIEGSDWRVVQTNNSEYIFFYHIETQQSLWTLPGELKILCEKKNKENQEKEEKNKIKEQQQQQEENNNNNNNNNNNINFKVLNKSKRIEIFHDFLNELEVKKTTEFSSLSSSLKVISDPRWIQLFPLNSDKRIQFQQYKLKLKK